MRFYHFLLLATASLLSSCNATATVLGEGQVMTSADAAVPVRAPGTSNSKRSLRYYDTEEDDEADKYHQKNGKYDEDEEERNWTVEQIARWAAKADDWVELRKTPVQIKDKLTGLNGVMSEKNLKKYQLFLAKWGRANPGELGRR